MSANRGADVPFVQTIFHPTDFSPESEEAFAHALAIALFRKGEITLVHAGDEYLDGDDWQKFPAVLTRRCVSGMPPRARQYAP